MLLPSRFLRAALALVTLGAVVGLGVTVGCSPDEINGWLCLNPVTGKDDLSIYDANHYVDDVFDPCNCYDPCGPEKTCPIVVDAGPLPPGCDVDGGADAGDGG